MHIRPGMSRTTQQHEQKKAEGQKKFATLSKANASTGWGSTAQRLAKQIVAFFSFSPKSTDANVQARATPYSHEEIREAYRQALIGEKPAETVTTEKAETVTTEKADTEPNTKKGSLQYGSKEFMKETLAAYSQVSHLVRIKTDQSDDSE